MNKIKVITRNEMPETNSSSTHSVVISDQEDMYDSETCNLKVDPDGVLRLINIIGHFGWGWDKYNDAHTKALYVSAFAVDNEEVRERLIEVLTEFTGAKKVEFSWEENDTEGEPEIDHQSYHDMFNLICENKDSIKDFIFNKKSWLFIGNDNSSEPKDFFEGIDLGEKNEGKRFEALMTIHFGGEIGDFNISLSNLANKGTVEEDVIDALTEWVTIDLNGVAKPKIQAEDLSDTASYEEIIGDEVIFFSCSEHNSIRSLHLPWEEQNELIQEKIKKNESGVVFRFKYSIVSDEFGSI